MKKVILALGVCLLLSGCGVVKGHSNSWVNWLIHWGNENYEEDSATEEYIEDVIEDMTGLEMDLSPCSEEED